MSPRKFRKPTRQAYLRETQLELDIEEEAGGENPANFSSHPFFVSASCLKKKQHDAKQTVAQL